MTTAINDYVLNDVNEPANWSAVERALLAAVVGKLPNAGATVTATSRHSHAVLVSANALVDPAVSVDNNGDVSLAEDLFMAHGKYIEFGDWGNITSSVLSGLAIFGDAGVYIQATTTATIRSHTNTSIISTQDTYINIGNDYGVGINCTPNAVLEVEDSATSKSVIVKITQDDETPYGLVIGNDSCSLTDTNGLRLQMMNSSYAKISTSSFLSIEIESGQSGDVILDCSTGQIQFQIAGTKVFEITGSGLVPTTNYTIHAIAQNGAPTSTTEGALWLDLDAGGNGHLKCYAAGGWRTVATL